LSALRVVAANPRAAALCNLDGREPQAGRARVHQHRRLPLEAAFDDQIHERGENASGMPAALTRSRLPPTGAGNTWPAGAATYSRARPPRAGANRLSRVVNRARDLEPQNLGFPGRGRVVPGDLREVGAFTPDAATRMSTSPGGGRRRGPRRAATQRSRPCSSTTGGSAMGAI